MIHILYSAPFNLSKSFSTPDFFAAKRRDSNCCRIFENTITNTISVFDSASPLANQTLEDTGHYNLMVRLSETLPENSTLVLPDVITLGSNVVEAISVVERFLDSHIHLEFLDSPWMNTKDLELLFRICPYETKTAFISSLTKTIEWKISSPEKSRIPDPKISQATTKVKKNCE
jgi:hypothetical protein